MAKRDLSARPEIENFPFQPDSNRLRMAQLAGNVGLWEWDIASGKTWWSCGLYKILELDEGEAEASFEKFFDHVHEADRDRLSTELKNAISEKRGINSEFRIRTSSGAIKWLLSSAEVTLDPAGEVTFMSGANVDITAQKEAEDALRMLNGQLRETVEQQIEQRERLWSLSEDFIVVLDSQNHIVRCNKAVSGFCGSSLPLHFCDLVHADDWHQCHSALDAARATGGRSRFDCKTNNVLFNDRHLSWSAAYDETNSMIFAIGRDITQVAEQKEQNRQLENRLTQVQRMEMLGELASGVAHDFNNLLMPIVSVLDLMQKHDAPSPEIRNLLSGATLAAQQARQLVRRILDFAKNQHMPPTSIELNALLVTLFPVIRQMLPSSIKVKLDLDQKIPALLLPASQLEVTLINLVMNARDAMPDGGTITILTRYNARKQTASIIVSDQGCGMDQQTCQKATERFFTTKGFEKGTGLGLYLANRFVKQSGGKLRIKSELGNGTEIMLELPTQPQSGPDSEGQETTSGKRLVSS